MEDVRIYDYEFNLLHIEHDIVSCNWSFYENDVGTFEMHFPLQSRLTEIISNNRYLVAVQGEKKAIITGRQLTTEGILYGKTCNWILTRFCINQKIDTDELYNAGTITTKDAQAVCAYLISLGMGDIDNFVLTVDEELDFGDVYLKNDETTSVFSLIQNALAQDKAGHIVDFDVINHQWVFQATKGSKLSVVLSAENRNAYDTEYTEDLQEAFFGGYYKQKMADMGDWDAADNNPFLSNGKAENYAKGYRVSTEGTRFGIGFSVGDCVVCDNKDGIWKKADSIENFTVHIPSNLSGIYAWETFLSGENEKEATQAISEKLPKEQVMTKTKNFLYGRDYQLGDSVLLQSRKGTVASAKERRITGVNLWYEVNDIGQQPIFEEESGI